MSTASLSPLSLLLCLNRLSEYPPVSFLCRHKTHTYSLLLFLSPSAINLSVTALTPYSSEVRKIKRSSLTQELNEKKSLKETEG